MVRENACVVGLNQESDYYRIRPVGGRIVGGSRLGGMGILNDIGEWGRAHSRSETRPHPSVPTGIRHPLPISVSAAMAIVYRALRLGGLGARLFGTAGRPS
jgi:hypothetical protein